jgi:hypothetical protein
MIQVDQCQLSYAAAGQGLCSPGTNTADADDHDMGGANLARTSHAIQALKPTKPALL